MKALVNKESIMLNFKKINSYQTLSTHPTRLIGGKFSLGQIRVLQFELHNSLFFLNLSFGINSTIE